MSDSPTPPYEDILQMNKDLLVSLTLWEKGFSAQQRERCLVLFFYSEVVHPKQVAREAALMLMEHEPNVSRPGAWVSAVTRRLLDTYDVADMTAQELYDLEKPITAVSAYSPRPSDHDPNCDECAGSGWRTVDPDTNTVGRCDCTATLADVHELRPA